MVGIGSNRVDPGLKKLTTFSQLPSIKVRNAHGIAGVLIVGLLGHIQHLLVNHGHQEARLPYQIRLQAAYTHLDNVVQEVDLQSVVDHFERVVIKLQLAYE